MLHEVRKRCHGGSAQNLNKSSPSSSSFAAQSLKHHSPVSRGGSTGGAFGSYSGGSTTQEKNTGSLLDMFVQSLILLPGNISSSPCIAQCCYHHNSYGPWRSITACRCEGRSPKFISRLQAYEEYSPLSWNGGHTLFKLGSTTLNQESSKACSWVLDHWVLFTETSEH